MKRSAVCLFAVLAIGGWGGAVFAAPAGGGKADKTEKAADKGDVAGEEPGPNSGPDISGDLDLSDKEAKNVDAAAMQAVRASTTLSWQDIVVVPRKRFLKGGRFELAPFTGMSVNDILVRHYVFGVDLNFFLTNVLWVGLQGNYYIKSLTEQQSLLGLQYNRIPTLNRYLYGGALNFGYVPFYGKFALVNKGIIHWEIYASAGVGVTQTEIIPRTPGDATFNNLSLTPNVAIGGRFFLFDWLTLNYAIRDYVIIDKFEPANRMPDETPAQLKARADGAMVHNIMFYAGVGIYLPTKFSYKTPR